MTGRYGLSTVGVVEMRANAEFRVDSFQFVVVLASE